MLVAYVDSALTHLSLKHASLSPAVTEPFSAHFGNYNPRDSQAERDHGKANGDDVDAVNASRVAGEHKLYFLSGGVRVESPDCGKG